MVIAGIPLCRTVSAITQLLPSEEQIRSTHGKFLPIGALERFLFLIFLLYLSKKHGWEMPVEPARPVLSFVDRAVVRRMPKDVHDLLNQGSAVLAEGSAWRFGFRVSWLSDWLFVRVKSRGVYMSSELGTQPPPGYAVVHLSLGGSPPSLKSTPIGRCGTIALSRWDEPYDFSQITEFDYLIAHMPCAALEATQGGSPTPYDRAIPAYRGPGSILATSLTALADCTLGNETDQDLRSMLPEYARLIQTTLARAQPDCESDTSGVDMEAVRDCLGQHLSDPGLTSEQVAIACGMSRRQLYRHFEAAGQSFAETLRTLRLEKAAFVLRDSPRLSMAEVAYRCGFASPISFSRSFKAKFGYSPRHGRV